METPNITSDYTSVVFQILICPTALKLDMFTFPLNSRDQNRNVEGEKNISRMGT